MVNQSSFLREEHVQIPWRKVPTLMTKWVTIAKSNSYLCVLRTGIYATRYLPNHLHQIWIKSICLDKLNHLRLLRYCARKNSVARKNKQLFPNHLKEP